MDVSISTGNITSSQYTIVNVVSLVVECGVVWYDHNTSLSCSVQSPLEPSNFFFILFNVTLFADSACCFPVDGQHK